MDSEIVEAQDKADVSQDEQSPSQAAFAFVQKIAADLSESKDLDLPGFPDVITRLQQALNDPNGSLKQISAVINCEPALAARFLQLSNSAAFRTTPEPIGDLRTAIAMLGLDVVRATATSFAMKQMEHEEWLKPLRPELKKIWQSSNSVAATAFTLARSIEGIAPDKAMLAGLFHQLGRLYILTLAQRDDASMLDDPDWNQAIDDWHPTIARAVLESWGLPEDVTMAVESQNDLYHGGSEETQQLSVLIAACKYYMDLENLAERDEELLSSVHFGGVSFSQLVVEHKDQIAETVSTFS